VFACREHRTQAENREAARARLAALMEEALTPPRLRKKSRLNRIGREERLKGKKVRGTIKANRGKVDW
jgi:ribosome-associated protein